MQSLCPMRSVCGASLTSTGHDAATNVSCMKAVVLGYLATAGCAGSSPPAQHSSADSPRPTCQELASACHARDAESKAAHDCHIFFHAPENTEGACMAKRSECAAACGLETP